MSGNPEGALEKNIDKRMELERAELAKKQARWLGREGRIAAAVSPRARAARVEQNAALDRKERDLRLQQRMDAFNRQKARTWAIVRANSARWERECKIRAQAEGIQREIRRSRERNQGQARDRSRDRSR